MDNESQPFLHVPAASGDGPRFESRGVLGKGAYGTVYDVFDRDLQRAVAIKVLDQSWAHDPTEVDAFISEARTVARLDHPAIVPLYDIRHEGGGPWFAMRQISGRTLHDILDERVRPTWLSGPRSMAMTLHGACNALAAAHRQGIVHRDIKPANLLLSEHGDLWVLDWGVASTPDPSSAAGAVIGTPQYMAPEQARGGVPTPAWDVYAMGAVLHEVVYGRLPLGCGDVDEAWWERKRRGEIDPPSGSRLAPIPPALRSIIGHCLQADPACRYADAGELAADMRAFLADEPVRAHRESLPARGLRLFRRHRRAVLLSAPVVLAFALVTGAWLVERIKLQARWGAPFATLDSPGWSTLQGSFDRGPGFATCLGPTTNILVLNRPCEGGLAVEYTAEIDPSQTPGDVSIALPRSVASSDSERRLIDPIYLLTATWDNTSTRIRLGDGTTIASATQTLVPGRRYRIRCELLDGRITLAIDGRSLCEAQFVVPDGPRYVALYGYYPGKRWSDLRIWQRGLAERVSSLAIGDAFLRSDPPDFRRAAVQYERVARSLPPGDAADLARQRQGLALAQAGDRRAAAEAWDAIADRRIETAAWANGVILALQREDDDEIMTAWRRLASLGDNGLMTQMAWSALCRRITVLSPDSASQVLKAHGGLPDSLLVREGRTEALLRLERWPEAVDASAGLQPEHANALLRSGRTGEAIADPGTPPSLRVEALIQCARFDEALAVQPRYPNLTAKVLVLTGRGEECLTAPWADANIKAVAALALGRHDEVIRLGARSGDIRLRALCRTARTDQVLAETPGNPRALILASRAAEIANLTHPSADLRRAQVVLAIERGDPPPSVGPPNMRDPADIVLCEVVVPALRAAQGDAQARAQLVHTAADPRPNLAWRVAPLAAAALGQRAVTQVALYQAGDQALAQALAAELAGDQQRRRQAWSAWLGLSAAVRNPDDDPALERIAHTRSR